MLLYYLALHGSPGRIASVLDTIGSDGLCEAFRGYGARDCLVYFGACSVLRWSAPASASRATSSRRAAAAP